MAYGFFVPKRSGGGRNIVRFKKRSGGTFVKQFRSRSSKARAIKGWRKRGGKIVSSY